MKTGCPYCTATLLERLGGSGRCLNDDCERGGELRWCERGQHYTAIDADCSTCELPRESERDRMANDWSRDK